MLGFGRPSLWYSFSFPLLELTYATYSKHEKKFEELKIEQQHSIESYGHANSKERNGFYSQREVNRMQGL